MRTPNRTLTEQELEIMKVVWEKKAASTVREVYEALRDRKPRTEPRGAASRS